MRFPVHGALPAGSASMGSLSRQRGLVAVIVAAVLASGCFSAKDPNEGCDDVSEYQSSSTAPGIVVPEGMTAPNGTSTFRTPPAPDGAEAASAKVPGAACLARSPDFFRKDPAAPKK